MNEKQLLGLFCLGLLLFVGLSTVSSFHDSPEYYQLARLFADQGNQPAFSGHSLVYPYLMSFVLFIFPASIFAIKLVNAVWILLTALLLFWFNRKTLWLFVFSPLVWMTAPEFTPVLPAMFFLTAMYLCLQKWLLHKHVWKYFALSALAAGCAFAFYTPSLIMLFFFILAFLRRESLQVVLLYLLFTLPAVILRLLLDWVYTGMPFYSLVRYFGVNLKVVLGVSSTTTHGALHGILSPHMWLVFVVVAPLLLLLYRLNWRTHLDALVYLVPCFLFFFVRSGMLKYFLLFSPIILLLLSSVLDKREVRVNALFGLVLVCLLTFGYFGVTEDVVIQQDLVTIQENYDYDVAVIALRSAYLDFSDKRYIWDEEYALASRGESVFSGWTFASEQRVDLYKQLRLSADLVRWDDDNYADVQYWIAVPSTDRVIDSFERIECFNYLCVYERSS